MAKVPPSRTGANKESPLVGSQRAKPDWPTWGNMVLVRLYQAVALSVDIDPDAVDPFGERDAPDLGEFFNRLRVADSALGLKLPVVKRERAVFGIGWDKVRLDAFAKWVVGTRWPIPEEFPRPQATPAVPSAPATAGGPANSGSAAGGVQPGGEGPQPGVTIQLPHTTKVLEALFKVMREHWAGYDPRSPPKSTVIAADLDQALGWKARGNGEPSRSAQTLAAAIRPDDISEADKRNRKRGRGGTS